MARAFIHRPFDEHIVLKPTGILMHRLKLLGSTAGFVNAGNYENVTLSMEVEEEDVWSPQTAERSKVAKITGEASLTLAYSLQQAPDFARVIAMQSDPELMFDQPALENQSFTIVDAVAGTIYKLPHFGITDWAAESAADAVYVDEVDAQLDAASGNFEIIKHALGVEKATVTITYDTAAIVGRRRYAPLSNTDLHFESMFRSTNKYGPRQLVELWDGKHTADGEVTLGANSSDQASIGFTAEIFATATADEIYKYGRVTDLL